MLAVTFDGASVNRRLGKLHDSQQAVFKLKNVNAPDERDLFFFSDPHLIKTTRTAGHQVQEYRTAVGKFGQILIWN